MAVCVISLEHTLAPATESALERNHHAVVVGNCFCIDLLHLDESRVGRAVWNRVVASPRRKGAEAPCVRTRVQNEFVDSMMAKLADAERSLCTKRLL